MTVGEIGENRVRDTLASTFGYSSFRPLQGEIVRSILGGEDVFVLMPTGGGKSLCYQLPALLLDGATIVVSPLIALMKDQVDALNTLGIAATFINSSLDPGQINRRQAALIRGEVKLVYVAPERLMMPAFLQLLRQVPLALIAIDEAHCISEWGHDFRPEYRQLADLRTMFPSVPLGAFTATATPRVQGDISTQLRLGRAAVFRGSFNRPNLYYSVLPKKNAYSQLTSYLRAHRGASGIIYCGSRAGTEDLAGRLRADGFSAAAYHAGLESEDRRRRQEAFIKDEVPIITATIAFGMGIDKPDVRFVAHYDLPKTLENYYQESGRAGRDGEPSDCFLFYSAADAMRIRHFIEEKATVEERRVAQRQLQQMIDWAESGSCRRQALLAYFGEHTEPQDPPCCDMCHTPAVKEDVTVPAQMFLSCVIRTGERFGAGHVIDVLRGARNQRVLTLGHDRLSTYGIGKDRAVDAWKHLARELVRRDLLHQDPEYSTLKVTDAGKEVLFRGAQVVTATRQVPAHQPEHVEQAHPDLFERLRALRTELAASLDIAPYMVVGDRTLRCLAAELPADEEHLLRISGIGRYKAQEYGKMLLDTIAAYVRETGATPESPPAAAPARRKRSAGSGGSVHETLQLFREGQSIADIARARDLSPRTVETHLAEALEAGESVDLDRLIPPNRRIAIEAAIADVGNEYLKPVMDVLGDGYTYGELRLVRAALTKNTNHHDSEQSPSPREVGSDPNTGI